MQNAQRIHPPRLPQVRAGGNRDIFVPGPWFFVASLGPRGVRSAAHISGPGPGSEPPLALQRPAGSCPHRARQPQRSQRVPRTRTAASGGWCANLLNQRRRARVHQGAARSAVSVSAPAATPLLSPGARPPRRPVPRPLTNTTEPRTASDTLCRSSAAVPGLLSRLVNLRTSAMAAGAGFSGRTQCPGPRRPQSPLLPLFTRLPAGHNAPPYRRPSLPPAAPPSSPASLPRLLARCLALRRLQPLPPLEKSSPARATSQEGGRVWEKGCVEAMGGGGRWGGEVTR